MSKSTALKTFSLDTLELVRATQTRSEMDMRVNFPFSPSFPASTGVELDGGHNVVYFELDGSSPYWGKMTTSGGIAIHVSGEYPGLNMELWAIRRN